jgi:hypothetical protein
VRVAPAWCLYDADLRQRAALTCGVRGLLPSENGLPEEWDLDSTVPSSEFWLGGALVPWTSEARVNLATSRA